MGITVLKNNVPWGPFTRAQIDEGLERGDFTLQTLAHAPGMKGWLPLEELIHSLEPVLPAVPVTRDLPPVPSVEALQKSVPAVAPALPSLPPPIEEVKITELKPASFFRRFMAFVIDCAILFVPIFVIMGLCAAFTALQGWWQRTDAESMRQEWELFDRNFQQTLLLAAVGLAWIYAAGLEASNWQATLGKRWMGIYVTDAHGERLGFLRASGRHFGKYLSALPCFLGFIWALFSSRGRAWHDCLARTRVVRQEKTT